MRTPDEIHAGAIDEPAFSNGTEGYAWQDNWCGQCVHDDEATEKWCPILTEAILGRTPAEWIEQPWQQIKGRPEGETAPVPGDRYHCVEFEPREDGDGNDEPEPGPRWDPEMPGQTTIFEVFADQFVTEIAEAPRVDA